MTHYPKPPFPTQHQPVPGSQRKMDPYPDCGEQSYKGAASVLQLSVLLYVSIIVGVAFIGGFIRWMSCTFDARPTLNQCIGFAAYTVVG
ncbi:YIP1 family protein [Pseudomonas sp. C1C7]|uniref:Yip1 family protein n=1 Tax=Pseudomonas sp. C1C7 TaxID=2735272 RepID=UPI0035588011